MNETQVSVWLDDPVTKEFFKYIEAQAEWADTAGRQAIRVPGNPYMTAENHAKCDGTVQACAWLLGVADPQNEAHRECFYPEDEDE